MQGDPAGEALAEPAAEQVHVDVLVGADPALEGDRHDLVGRLDEVDPGVVVVDDPARLLDDDPPDAFDRRGPAQPAGGRLERRQLGGAGLGPGEQLGVGRGRSRRAWRRVAMKATSAVGPGTRLAGDRRQGADDLVVVDERRDEVAGERRPGSGPVAWRGSARTSDQAVPGPSRRTSPTQPSSTPNAGRAARDVVLEAGPGGDDQLVVADAGGS